MKPMLNTVERHGKVVRVLCMVLWPHKATRVFSCAYVRVALLASYRQVSRVSKVGVSRFARAMCNFSNNLTSELW